jgi:hypothetical protein
MLGLSGTAILRERLDLTHVQSAAHDALGERGGVGASDERPRMARAQRARTHQILHALGQLQES